MYRTDKKNKRKGFTLFETLMVTGMLSVVALAIYSTFNSGLKIWQRLSQRMPAEELNIFVEKITDDLRNSFSFSEIPFVGLKDKISFTTLIRTQVRREKGESFTVGQVVYYFNAKNESLDRQQADYSKVFQNEFSLSRQMMEKVESVNVQYYFYDLDRKTYAWKDMWFEEDEEAKIPLAVRIKIQFIEDDEIKQVQRTISIPAAAQFHYE